MAFVHSFTTFVTLSLLSATYAAIGPVADLHISNANVSPDGFTRSASLVNGVVDTTLITAQKGDTFQLNVINELTDSTQYQSTSIHWHGLLQQGTNWADGGTFVTQCPISKSNSFLYTFAASNPGTYWYHSHLATQYCDGVRGPLVVYDPNDPFLGDYNVDDDTTVITLGDWYHTVSKQAGAVPRPDAILINGLGRSTTTTTAPLAVINVEFNKKYRFRLVNIACDPNFTFQIDGHSFTVIEADGQNVQPLVVDQLQIFAGQRYSIILNANQAVGNYWIRAKPNVAVSTSFTNGLNSAILRYVGATVADPTTTQATPTAALVETNLHPLTTTNPVPGTPVKGGVTKPFNMAITFTGGNFAINGVSFQPPTVPVLLQILSGAATAQSLLPSGSIYEIDQGDTVELSIPGGAAGSPHPFHLHGHTFHVIRSAGSTAYNYDNPVQRDVVSTGVAGDNVTIRFKVDNPGPWFLHCHIDWHLNTGLAVVFAEDVPGTAAANPVPAAWNDLCPTYNSQPPSNL